MTMWTKLICLRTGTNRSLLWTC